MKCDIDEMRKSAKILKNAKDRLKDSVDVIDNTISKLSKEPKGMTEEEAKTYKEKCECVKNELKSLKKRINNQYVDSAKTIKKWITNKANKLEESEKLSKNALSLDNVGISPISDELSENNNNISSSQESKINNVYNEMINISKKEKYFTQEQLEESMNKIISCSSDKEFEKMYKKSGQNGNVNELESFKYKGKIYLRPNASEHTIKYEINRDIASSKRVLKLQDNNNKPSVPTKGINKSLAEFVTRLDSNTDNKVSNNYDASVEFLEFLQNSLNSLGCVDLITKTGYGTKQELKAKLKEITGDNEFYNSMLNSMYTITEDSKATKKEINAAKNQLKKLTSVFQEKCGLYGNKNGITKDSDVDMDTNMNVNVNTELNTEANTDINTELNTEANVEKGTELDADKVNEEPNKENGTVTKKIDGQDVVLPEGDKVYFLDTGWLQEDEKTGKKVQKGSDSFIIESKDESGNPIYGLIDTGKDCTGDRIVEYLKELGVEKLDFVLITHGHADHTGGYDAIVDSGIVVKNLYIKNENPANKGSKKLTNVTDKVEEYNAPIEEKIKKAKTEEKKQELRENLTEVHWVNDKNNKKVQENQSIKLGTWDIQLFNTTDQIQGKKVTNKKGEKVEISENVNTITALATSNGKRVYFAGDAGNYGGIDAGTKAARQALKAANGEPIDVYKVAHHSRGKCNNTDDEVNILKPKISVATMSKKRIDSGESDFKQADDRIRKYTNGESYYTTAGTVVMNVADDGDLTVKQMPNYWTSGGNKVKKSKKA